MRRMALFSLFVLILAVALIGCQESGSVTDEGSLGVGLIAHYRFNGNAHDSSVTGNNGVASSSGVTYVVDRLSHTGKAVHFDGVAGRIAVSGFGQPLNGSPFSISFWVRTPAPDASSDNYIISDNFAIFDSSASVAIMLDISDSVYWLSSGITGVTGDSWKHVVITYDGNDVNIYVNGSATPAATAHHPGSVGADPGDFHSAGNLIFGNNGQTQYWEGSIDDFRVYNRVLSTTDIADLYTYND